MSYLLVFCAFSDSNELAPVTNANGAVIRFFRLVQAARDGQDQKDCLVLYSHCNINTEWVHSIDHDQLKPYRSSKLHDGSYYSLWSYTPSIYLFIYLSIYTIRGPIYGCYLRSPVFQQVPNERTPLHHLSIVMQKLNYTTHKSFSTIFSTNSSGTYNLAVISIYNIQRFLFTNATFTIIGNSHLCL